MKRACFFIAVMLLLGVVAASAQSVEQVMNNYMAAVSGGQGFEKINSMKMVMTGEMGAMGGQMGGMMEGRQMNYTMYMLKPNKFRMEMKVGPMNMTMGNDGSVSWMSMMGRTRELPNSDNPGFENMMAIYNGNIVEAFDSSEYAGAESFDGEQCHAINVQQEGQSSTLYFSMGSGLLMGMKSKTEQGEMMMRIGDYRDVQGYKVPHNYSMSMNGDNVMNMIIEEMVINPPVDASMFAKPN